MRRGVRVWGQARGLREGVWPALAEDLPFDRVEYDGVELDIEFEGGHAPDVEAAVEVLAGALGEGGWAHLDVIDHDAGELRRYAIEGGEVRSVTKGIDDVLESVVRPG